MILKIKIFFALSVILNIAFLSMATYIIHKKGGIKYIKNRMGTLMGTQNHMDETVYNHRLNRFNNLPYIENSVIFLGDSITADGQWAELFENGKIKNRGIPEDNTAGILSRLDNVTQLKPEKIFLMIGVNDLGSGRSVKEILKNYEEILKKIQIDSPTSKIYIESILPINNEKYSSPFFDNKKIDECNTELKILAKKYNFTFIDLNSLMKAANGQMEKTLTFDGIHITNDGYAIWRKALLRFMN